MLLAFARSVFQISQGLSRLRHYVPYIFQPVTVQTKGHLLKGYYGVMALWQKFDKGWERSDPILTLPETL